MNCVYDTTNCVCTRVSYFKNYDFENLTVFKMTKKPPH